MKGSKAKKPFRCGTVVNFWMRPNFVLDPVKRLLAPLVSSLHKTWEGTGQNTKSVQLPLSQRGLSSFPPNGSGLSDLWTKDQLKWKHVNMMIMFSSVVIRLIKSCTVSILWRWSAIAVLNGRMSQELVQFVDQYIQLAGSGAAVKEKRAWLW